MGGGEVWTDMNREMLYAVQARTAVATNWTACFLIYSIAPRIPPRLSSRIKGHRFQGPTFVFLHLL